MNGNGSQARERERERDSGQLTTNDNDEDSDRVNDRVAQWGKEGRIRTCQCVSSNVPSQDRDSMTSTTIPNGSVWNPELRLSLGSQ